MHYIQKQILDELRTNVDVRYARLNTGEIESGHFRYHLEQLISDGYVEQLERGLYRLSLKGQQYVDKLSKNSVNPASMPKLITYTLLRDGEKVLLQEKAKQPYMGLLNMIGGKLHEGEFAGDAAVREVYEKTGNKIDRPKLAGVFEIQIKQRKDLVTHAVAYVFISDVKAKDYVSDSIKALSINDLSLASNIAPDFLPVFHKLADDSTVHIDTIEIEAEIR